ncbi:LCP family protein [Peptoniphilus sp.]|uniref:LCP family protein n=1 Tax=Peptoniphilus sp. TaxID=1971214 RepID=UPI003D91D3AB
MKSFFKAFLSTILVILILGLGLVAAYFYFFDEKDSEKLNTNGEGLQFLLLGVDSLDAKNADNARSDTIMIVNVNPKDSSVNIISIPRDTYTAIKGYKNQKINHSFKYGGTELTLDTVNNLLGTNINHYITIDYRFVEAVVDALGGITVDVPIDMKYDDPTADPPLHIDIDQGRRNLNGHDAVGFLRFRKGYANADLGRVEAQQQFMSAMFSKIKDPKIILKTPKLMSAYVNYSENNMSAKELMKLAFSMKNMTSENIKTSTLPGYPKYKGGVSYYIMNENEADVVLVNAGFK